MNQWKNFEKEQPQKTGIKYLVVTSSTENGKEKITGYEVCEFYKKGQKIEIATFLPKKRASEDLSAADLIGYITCPIDGFYLRTNLVDGYFHDSLSGPKNEAEKFTEYMIRTSTGQTFLNHRTVFLKCIYRKQ